MDASPTAIAVGVWRITRGFPLRINVFFVREAGGVAVFDTLGEALADLASSHSVQLVGRLLVASVVVPRVLGWAGSRLARRASAAPSGPRPNTDAATADV